MEDWTLSVDGHGNYWLCVPKWVYQLTMIVGWLSLKFYLYWGVYFGLMWWSENREKP